VIGFIQEHNTQSNGGKIEAKTRVLLPKKINTAYIKPAVSETAPAASEDCTSSVPTTNTRHGGNNAEGVPAACSRGRAVEVDVNERISMRARIDFVIFRFRATNMVNYSSS